MTQPSDKFKIAAIQACPVFMDRDATIEKACGLIQQAGKEKASLAVFPETFVPGYPVWVWFIPPGHTHPIREVYTELHQNAVTVPSKATDALCKAARDAKVTVAIGINERNSEGSDSSLYCAVLYIGSDGSILGKHRKMVPTSGERLSWAQGDGSDLEVYDLGFARMGGLICWENYMPLARYALYAWGTQVYVAPTWDHGEPWQSTMRHIAKESRSFVIGCCSAVHKDDIPDRMPFKEKYLKDIDGWINPGDSMIVDPDGKIVAGPAHETETILYADVRSDQLVGPRWQLDTAGHYARPDVFELRVHRTPRPFVKTIEETGEGDSTAKDEPE